MNIVCGYEINTLDIKTVQIVHTREEKICTQVVLNHLVANRKKMNCIEQILSCSLAKNKPQDPLS